MQIVVIGAGMAGLTCASALHAAGNKVTVVEKSGGLGGRMATRRMSGAYLDHGAQFFTARSPEFVEAIEGWMNDGVVFEWSRGFGATPDGHPRYAVRGGITALARHIAEGVTIQKHAHVFAVTAGKPGAPQWAVVLDDATEIEADVVVSTCPLPQTYSLLVSAGLTFPRELLIDYDRTLALLAVLDCPADVPALGVVQPVDHPVISILTDNARKSISETPALTVHARHDWSAAHWDAPREETEAALLDAAAPWIGSATVIECAVKRWRFATPQRLWPEPFWQDDTGTLLAAGDAFAGPKATASNLEGAYFSGRRAAEALLARS